MKFFTLSTYTIFSFLLVSCSNEKAQSTTDQSAVIINADSAVDAVVSTVADSISGDDTEVIEEIALNKLKHGDYGVVKGIINSVQYAEMGSTRFDADVNGANMHFIDWTGTDGFTGVTKSMIGQELVIKYLYLEFLEEVDLHVNDTSVRSDWDRQNSPIVTEEDKAKPNLQKIDGVISWTMNEYGVSGDIDPSEYGIIKADGTKAEITGRVHEDLFLKLNGKEATVYYYASSELGVVTVTSPLKKEASQTKIDFIREKFGTITSKMETGEYTNTEFDVDGNGEVVQYKRAMDGDQLRFMSLAYCSDHGCDKTSYYFWDDQLIFEFQESSHWVGNTDKVSEKRNYYYDLEQIRSIEREMSGGGGYDKVKKQLAGKAQTTLPLGQPFDMNKIIIYFDISEEQAQKNTNIFFPDNN